MKIDTEYLFGILARLAVFFTCIPAHECAHGWVAYKLGDHTAKDQKRLTLNPFRHFDFMGTLSLILLGFGWAKPVPIDPRNFKMGTKKGMALTAAAGPAANILMALILLMLYKSLLIVFGAAGLLNVGSAAVLPVSVAFLKILSAMVLTNVSLAVFNLIPINPLDGSRILGVILPDRAYYLLIRYERYIFFALLLAMLGGVLDKPLRFLSYYVLELLNFLTSFLDVLARVILN